VSFSPHPIQNLSAHLHDLSQSVAIHILPGIPLGNNSSSTGSPTCRHVQPRLLIRVLHWHLRNKSHVHPPSSPLVAKTSKWTRRSRHPRRLCLTERYCQHLDNLPMTCPSNAQVASHRTYRTRYAFVPSVLHDVDPFIIEETHTLPAGL